MFKTMNFRFLRIVNNLHSIYLGGKNTLLLILFKIGRFVAIILFRLLIFILRIINIGALLFLFYLWQVNQLLLLKITLSFRNLLIFIIFCFILLDLRFLLVRLHYFANLFNLLHTIIFTLSAYLLRKAYLVANI